MDSNTEVDSLCEKVHNLEQKLHQAAEFGKQLLDANSELTDQLDKQAKEHRIDWEVSNCIILDVKARIEIRNSFKVLSDLSEKFSLKRVILHHTHAKYSKNLNPPKIIVVKFKFCRF